MTRWEWIGLFDIYSMIFWCVTYIECIRIGSRQKTYCVPLLALCINFCWELFSFVDYIAIQGENAFIYVLYGLWLFLDVGIVITYYLYGEREFFKIRRKDSHHFFIIVTTVVFGVVIGIVTMLYIIEENWKLYISFTDNVLMSALFIAMYYIRSGTRGQTLSIAITKCIGTFCATLTMVLSGQRFGVVMGGICLILDIAYVVILAKHPQFLPDDKSVMTLD